MNQIIISGRVSKELSVKGKTGFFTLANDRDYPFNKDQNGNKVGNYITVKVLGEKNVANVQKFLPKGTAVIITGHYFRDSWKEGNEYKEFNYILCEKWEFQVGKRDESNAQETTPVSNTTESEPSTNDTHTEEPPAAPDDDFVSVTDDDLNELPFR